MPAAIACIAGEEIYRQWKAGHLTGQMLPPHPTPFGPSNGMIQSTVNGQEFLLLPRYQPGMAKPAPHKVNHRANLYALKDLGVQCVVSWGPGGAIMHDVAVGDLVIPNDLIDFTYLPDKTFFEDSPLGFLRQFPVFCPTLRRLAGEVLREMKLIYHAGGTVAVREGPRLETPAEVRMLATVGADIVTHAFVPEVFLAKELELCYVAISYVVNYAETGSRHRPFATGNLFGGMNQQSDSERLSGAVASMSAIVSSMAEQLDSTDDLCQCAQAMADHRRQYGLRNDWREWYS